MIFVRKGGNRLKYGVSSGDLVMFAVRHIIICTRNEAGRYN